MSKCTCVERPVLGCLVHYDRSLAHRVLVQRYAQQAEELEALKLELHELTHCDHRFMWFGDQKKRRCADCNKIESEALLPQQESSDGS